MKPEFVHLLIPAITDGLPDRIWTRDTQGDPDHILQWDRTGGGWRTTYPDGSRSHAHSTRSLRIYRPIFTTDPRSAAGPNPAPTTKEAR